LVVKGKGREDEFANQSCSVCGGDLNPEGECTICGTKHQPPREEGKLAKQNPGLATKPQVQTELGKEEIIKIFTEISGIGESKAQVLYEGGYTSLEALQQADVSQLAALSGIGEKLAKTIHEDVGRMLSERAEKENKEALTKWLTGESETEGLSVWLGGDLEAKAKIEKEQDPGIDALRKWLSGEEEALQEWLGIPRKEVVEEAGEVGKALVEREKLLAEKEEVIRQKEERIEDLRLELEELRKTLKEELGRTKTGGFDPMRYIEETARLSKELHSEIKRRKELEEEIEHIKKGSIAVIKYVKAQQLKAGGPGLRKKLGQEINARKKLEVQLKKNQELLAKMKEQLDGKISELPKDMKELKEKELALAQKEIDIKAWEEELKAREQAMKRGE